VKLATEMHPRIARLAMSDLLFIRNSLASA
jgi:hypothetical protein